MLNKLPMSLGKNNNAIKKILRTIRAVVLWCAVSVVRHIARNKYVWVFGSRFGERYDENSKYLFEYVSKKRNDIRAIWITKEEKVYEHIKSKGQEVYYKNSALGWYYSLVAGVAIISVCLRDINSVATAGAKIIQLWHGTPMRMNNIGAMNENYEFVIVAAEEFLHTQFLADKNNYKFVLTGYPKNDELLSSSKNKKINMLFSNYNLDKMALYLPTHRQYFPIGSSDMHASPKIQLKFNLFSKYGFNLENIENVMKENKCIFVLKLHPLQQMSGDETIEKIKKSKYLHIVEPDDPLVDVYEYLKYADILITDYSSVLFDYLLLDRPIIFTPFDYNESLKDRTMRFPYDEITPGPKAKNWDEMCSNLSEILAGKDGWKEMRRNVNKRFNSYRDGNSSERVYKEIRLALGLDGHM